jgi:hypothetical protein
MYTFQPQGIGGERMIIVPDELPEWMTLREGDQAAQPTG